MKTKLSLRPIRPTAKRRQESLIVELILYFSTSILLAYFFGDQIASFYLSLWVE
jgi:hypothetical protein